MLDHRLSSIKKKTRLVIVFPKYFGHVGSKLGYTCHTWPRIVFSHDPIWWFKTPKCGLEIVSILVILPEVVFLKS